MTPLHDPGEFFFMKTQFLSLFTVALFATGCASITKVETRQADAYEQHKEKDGLVVGVHPFTDSKEVKDTFNVNLLANRLLPILVVAENRSPSSSFLIAKENVYVFTDTQTNSLANKKVAEGLADSGTAIGFVAAAAGSTGLLFVGLAMAADATVIQHNLADKQFISRTLDPGQKAQGFIFFNIPEKAPPSGAYHVSVRVKNAATGELVPLDFPVNLNLKKQ
jgi:hypothetical protein